ncbi:zinc-binding dehydrogenase [uncultured Chitinophaga sp.]|uniref:zinc-binding dehydrogenase n=1 Tax=uncultured Chitinophaga sp. TaxID=339340 RepID=UPI0025D53BAB|nr:zinc-binding dehydrogenase [uncultured Chitinophaga sp.]
MKDNNEALPQLNELEIYVEASTSREGEIALFKGPGQDFELKMFKVRPLRPGEVLVKNVYTTICGSDLHTYCGLRNEPCPTVLGHEIVGEVLEIAPGHPGIDLRGRQLEVGDRITWTVFSSDPNSVNSLRGMPQKGDKLYKYGHVQASGHEVFHGGLATYCILQPDTGIIKLADTMPLPVAATLNCSVSTVAGALRMAGNIKGKTVLITGMGHLGITCAAMCREAGATWIGGADVSAKRLNDALSFGADEVFDMNADTDVLLRSIIASTGGKGADVVFDMSGAPDAMEFGIAGLGIGGCAIWVGAVFNTRPLQIDPERIIRSLITIRGIHNYNYEDFQYAFDFMDRNWQKYPFIEVVEKEFSLDEVEHAFVYAVAHKPLRVGIKF